MPTTDLMTENLKAVYALAYRNKAFLDGILDEKIRSATLEGAGIVLTQEEKDALTKQLNRKATITGKDALMFANILISAAPPGPGPGDPPTPPTPPPPPPPPPWMPPPILPGRPPRPPRKGPSPRTKGSSKRKK